MSMRVTSSMMTNNMLLHMNRAMRDMDTHFEHLASGRRINVPSENPLVAARAMKFRSNIVANENFQRNVETALGWMERTEAALDSVVETLMVSVRDHLNHAANDFLSLAERDVLVNQLQNLLEQIGIEMNSQQSGRYLFSGLRTDQPPIFRSTPPSDLSFRITQNFNFQDIERTFSLQIFNPERIDENDPSQGYQPNLPVRHEVHILKLAYSGSGMGLPVVPGFGVVEMSATDRDAYAPVEPGTVHFIRETGELVFNSADVTGNVGLGNFPMNITYEMSQFQIGDLNPAVYFEAELLYAPDGHSLRHLWNLGPPHTFLTMENQELRYEFGRLVTVPVNTLAKNAVTDKLMTDLRRTIDFVRNVRPTDENLLRAMYSSPPFSLEGTELNNKIAEHQSDEMAMINEVMNDRFNNMLMLIDRHGADTRREITDLGSRGRMLELIQTRLEGDEGNLNRLMNSNEATDVAWTGSMLATAEVRFLISINVGASIINVTLANFLQV
ncbi:MAG: hypothetical protein FWG65_00035 [Turicibacter sp.]|nr:hypothetical protein [Turicibacter sp.]